MFPTWPFTGCCAGAMRTGAAGVCFATAGAEFVCVGVTTGAATGLGGVAGALCANTASVVIPKTMEEAKMAL